MSWLSSCICRTIWHPKPRFPRATTTRMWTPTHKGIKQKVLTPVFCASSKNKSKKTTLAIWPTRTNWTPRDSHRWKQAESHEMTQQLHCRTIWHPKTSVSALRSHAPCTNGDRVSGCKGWKRLASNAVFSEFALRHQSYTRCLQEQHNSEPCRVPASANFNPVTLRN